MIIDVHTHIVPEHFPSGAGRAAGNRWPAMDHTQLGQANVMIEGKNFRTVLSRCWDVPRRAGELAGQGIDRQVLSPMPQLCDYGMDRNDGADMAMYLNETIMRMVDAAPDRFYGLGSVPLQDVDGAAKMLSRVKALGLRGVEIVSNVEGVSPGDARFHPFFKEAAALDMAIFMHAQHPTYMDRIVGSPMLENAVGFPIESALAGASLITGGVLEASPELRVCISHGGGNFWLMLPRLNATMGRAGRGGGPPGQGAPAGQAPKRTPLEQARQMYFDDILFDNRAVRYLIDIAGVSQVVVGSDYPFQSRAQTPDQEFEDIKLTPTEREAIGSRNALRFLGLGD